MCKRGAAHSFWIQLTDSIKLRGGDFLRNDLLDENVREWVITGDVQNCPCEAAFSRKVGTGSVHQGSFWAGVSVPPEGRTFRDHAPGRAELSGSAFPENLGPSGCRFPES